MDNADKPRKPDPVRGDSDQDPRHEGMSPIWTESCGGDETDPWNIAVKARIEAIDKKFLEDCGIRVEKLEE